MFRHRRAIASLHPPSSSDTRKQEEEKIKRRIEKKQKTRDELHR